MVKQTESSCTTAETITRAVQAILSHGSAAHPTAPSGPMLELLTDLASEGELVGFAEAFDLFSRVKPANAAHVRSKVPGKVLNGYLLGRLRLSATAFQRWEKS